MPLRLLLWIFIVCAAQSVSAEGIPFHRDSLPSKLKNGWRFHSDTTASVQQIIAADSLGIPVDLSKRYKGLSRIGYRGKGWFTLRINVDSSLMNLPLCYFLDFSGAAEVYVDTLRIGSTGRFSEDGEPSFVNHKIVPVPFQFTQTGSHCIALRVHEFRPGKHDFIGFEFQCETAQAGIEDLFINSVAVTFIVLFIGVLFLSLGIIHLFYFLYYRSILSNLFFSLFMFGLAAIMGVMLIAYFNFDPVEQESLSVTIYFLLPATVCAYAAFIHFLFKGNFRVWLAAYGIALLGYILTEGPQSDSDGLALMALLALAIVHGLFRIVQSIYRRQAGTWIIGTGIFFTIAIFATLLILGLTTEINVNTETLTGKILVLGVSLAIVSIPLSMSIYQAWTFSRLNISLRQQLAQVQELSAKTIAQELEKQQILENQKSELEIKVAERTQQLSDEKQKSDDLLLNILPSEVAEELKQKGSAEARLMDDVTVLFTDFKGFTQMAEQLSPQALVNDIHECFSAFDRIMERYGIEKIKTIGDAYMAASGLPSPKSQHAIDAVHAAREMVAFIEAGKALKIARGLPYFEIRVGVHTGPVVAGIVGIKKFAYDIWGDTVNTAARMESSGEIGRINISEQTYQLVKDQVPCTYRGEVEAKGKGKVRMYFVEP